MQLKNISNFQENTTDIHSKFLVSESVSDILDKGLNNYDILKNNIDEKNRKIRQLQYKVK